MNFLIKLVLQLFIGGCVLWIGNIWWQDFKGMSEVNPDYINFFAYLAPIAICVVAVLLSKIVYQTDFNKMLPLMLLAILLPNLQSCSSYAKTNQQVVYSEDCGKTWHQVKSGTAVPRGTGNRCFIKETMPGFAMQGTLTFYVQFVGQVKVEIDAAYDYEIFDPLLFMQHAKTLGKANSSADGAAADNQRFESAENRVIDVRIKDISSAQFKDVDVVKHDMNVLADEYLELINADLAKRGVRLTILVLVPDYQDQTKMAIDAYNALRIYKANDMEELGKQIMVAKAGAPVIHIHK